MHTLATALPLMAAVSLAAALVAYLRTDRLADPATVERHGRATAARRDMIGFGVMTFVAGALAALLFGWLDGLWSATRIAFAVLGLGTAIALSVAAAIVRPKLGLGGVQEVTAVSLLCGLAYGVGLPYLLHPI